MGDLPVTDYSEATNKKDATVAEAIGNKSIVDENEDLGDDSDEGPPPFPYEYRGKPVQPAAGPDEGGRNNPIRVDKGRKSKLEEQEPDELDKRAIKAKAGMKKNV
ncbi:hypothetical protein BYT27DRAFT_7186365 [Phlegmacium glaucopus]|nr:hypothetical protein BYT27DRAFT_7186365 [Phlegmacium glaucopus]